MLRILYYSSCLLSLSGVVLSAYAQNISALGWAFSSTIAWFMAIHLAAERQDVLDILALLDTQEQK